MFVNFGGGVVEGDIAPFCSEQGENRHILHGWEGEGDRAFYSGHPVFRYAGDRILLFPEKNKNLPDGKHPLRRKE